MRRGSEQSQDPVDEDTIGGLQGIDFTSVDRFIVAANKRQADWQSNPPPWGEVEAVPLGKGSEGRRKNRRRFWEGVVDQQLHADELAVEMSTHLHDSAPEGPARDYYKTMVIDETDHVGLWVALVDRGGLEPAPDRNPHLERLSDMVLTADDLATSAFLMQGIFEDRVRDRFERIARMSNGTMLEVLCRGIKKDDTIHHLSGLTIISTIFENTPPSIKDKVAKAAREALPLYIDHVFWRPHSRDYLARFMYEQDRKHAREDIEAGKATAGRLGLDLSDIDYVVPDFPDSVSSTFIPDLSSKESSRR